MTTITCPRCPTTWTHRESTGHCAACHHTFVGIEAFDRHQTLTDAGRSTCHNPTTMTRKDGANLYEPYHPTPTAWNGTFWRLALTDAQRASHQAFVNKLKAERHERLSS